MPYQPWANLAPGEPVMVNGGPLAGVQGILLSTCRPNRLKVSISLLQRSIAVEIDSSWVRPLTSSPTPQFTTLARASLA
jgi:transcription antitermination factor NusG